MIKFAKVSKYADVDLPLPSRATKNSAGYDFVVAEDTIVPSYFRQWEAVEALWDKEFTLEQTAEKCKKYGTRPTLVPTGMKCYLDPDCYLELSARSSTPLKYGLILANGVGNIDCDYVDNPDNEGHIYFQVINLTPWPIHLKRGDKIGQGIIHHYEVVNDDAATGDRKGGFGSTTRQEVLL